MAAATLLPRTDVTPPDLSPREGDWLRLKSRTCLAPPPPLPRPPKGVEVLEAKLVL